mmetsp:Transcript_35347/g.55202  ORF Transcript_35347/g.55202 Transcript_35347/m.55202 type:complete len:103 (-) Transcript_35347:516-824(-)
MGNLNLEFKLQQIFSSLGSPCRYSHTSITILPLLEVRRGLKETSPFSCIFPQEGCPPHGNCFKELVHGSFAESLVKSAGRPIGFYDSGVEIKDLKSFTVSCP